MPASSGRAYVAIGSPFWFRDRQDNGTETQTPRPPGTRTTRWMWAPAVPAGKSYAS